MMQIVVVGELNHDDPKQTLVITDAYPQGTTSQIRTTKIVVPPQVMVPGHLVAFVLPFIADQGKSCIARFILVDQYRRKYKLQRISFRFVGRLPEASKTPAG